MSARVIIYLDGALTSYPADSTIINANKNSMTIQCGTANSRLSFNNEKGEELFEEMQKILCAGDSATIIVNRGEDPVVEHQTVKHKVE